MQGQMQDGGLSLWSATCTAKGLGAELQPKQEEASEGFSVSG